ncbi:MAG: hypothetical protein HYX65_07445 [Gemmatimonadetes bacterium]|nr:hypothetical protein [Gemmatimonadota bacterium]
MSPNERPHLHLHRDEGDDDLLTRLLREHYRAPANRDYWNGLEARVLRAIHESEARPFLQFAPWMRWAVAAAAVLAVAAAALEWRARDAEARMAYQAILGTEQPVARVMPSADRPAREMTIHDLVTTY